MKKGVGSGSIIKLASGCVVKKAEDGEWWSAGRRSFSDNRRRKFTGELRTEENAPMSLQNGMKKGGRV